MRITATTPAQAPSRAKARGRDTTGDAFTLAPAMAETPAPGLQGVDQVQSLDALLMLQSVDMPSGDSQRSARQGLNILEDLDQLKVSLLEGRVSPDLLTSLASRLSAQERSGDPELDRVLDEVEVRARVELAKLGHFHTV